MTAVPANKQQASADSSRPTVVVSGDGDQLALAGDCACHHRAATHVLRGHHGPDRRRRNFPISARCIADAIPDTLAARRRRRGFPRRPVQGADLRFLHCDHRLHARLPGEWLGGKCRHRRRIGIRQVGTAQDTRWPARAGCRGGSPQLPDSSIHRRGRKSGSHRRAVSARCIFSSLSVAQNIMPPMREHMAPPAKE